MTNEELHNKAILHIKVNIKTNVVSCRHPLILSICYIPQKRSFVRRKAQCAGRLLTYSLKKSLLVHCVKLENKFKGGEPETRSPPLDSTETYNSISSPTSITFPLPSSSFSINLYGSCWITGKVL